jgi:hypothetical protein
MENLLGGSLKIFCCVTVSALAAHLTGQTSIIDRDTLEIHGMATSEFSDADRPSPAQLVARVLPDPHNRRR